MSGFTAIGQYDGDTGTRWGFREGHFTASTGELWAVCTPANQRRSLSGFERPGLSPADARRA